ncbi:MAG: hypothetical protein R3C19_10570 [Planctomycetaceae bacterium]
MFSFRPRRLTYLLLLSATLLNAASAVAKVEAVKGKRYSLDKVHGPWMVMVASLRDVPEDLRKTDGLSAWEAADALVYELRLKGIPAYTFLQQEEFGELRSAGYTAGHSTGKYIARQEFIAVLAGNFPTAEDKDARMILDFVKNRFEPSFLKDKRNGGILPSTPGRRRALSRAMIVANPLRSSEDLGNNTIDPVVKQLNSGMEYSLLKNKGKYTLVVASFSGSSVMQVGHETNWKAMNHFDEFFGDSLDASANDAWQLCQALRMARKFGYDQDYDAWVYHDRFKSVVTIGSFDSDSDPRLVALAREFTSKPKPHPQTGEVIDTAEIFSIPRNGPPDKFWVFDIKPTLMEVPQIR